MSTTKLPPGLSNVASQAEAEAGTAIDKFMTPERTKQAIAALESATPAAGPTFIATYDLSAVGGTTQDVQDAAIANYNAWRLVFRGISSASTGASFRLKFYDNAVLVEGTGYTASLAGAVSPNNDAYWEFTGQTSSAGQGYNGSMDIHLDADNKVHIRGMSCQSNGDRGKEMIGFNSDGIATALDGFRILSSTGNFDAGSLYVYGLPSWTHA